MLMQQVHAVKDAAGRIPNPVIDPENPDLPQSIEVYSIKLSANFWRWHIWSFQLLNDGSSSLSQTCDTFISTLDDLMALSDKTFGQFIKLFELKDKTHVLPSI